MITYRYHVGGLTLITRNRVSFLILLCLLYAGYPTTAVADAISKANATLLGPNVYVFDPTMNSADIQKFASDIFKKMEANQFGTERYALLFKPGKYDVTFNVGFYTHVAGLGQNPDDVQINGGVNVNAEWLGNANATCNFWRTIENLAITPSSTKGNTIIAVSQAAPLRRLHVKGNLHLFAFDSRMNAGWASGGFLADSLIDGHVLPASQQQWLSRNSSWSRWQNAVWNMVFVGCTNTPAGQFPQPAYTVVDKTPVVREKPYLYIDSKGAFQVFVPSLQRDSQGITWSKGSTPGESLSLDKFYIAKPGISSATTINGALSSGKHILFTPGVYTLDEPLRITKPNTIVLGLGVPSLVPTKGQSIITTDDVAGVKIAGLILDAGSIKSKKLLEVGPVGSKNDHAANPTFLYDLTVRTGGPSPASNDIGIELNSNNVIADQIWIWRADHGNGAGWTTNPTKNGLVINGNNVIIYGLFNEHHNEYQTLWNGNGGRVYMYQSEMPYDIPNQAAWMSGKTPGFASYKVADHVTSHEAWGLGVYSFFRDAPVKANSAIEAPNAPGIKLHNLTTIWLTGQAGSEISHIVNDQGGRVYANRPNDAMRQTLKEFPNR